MILKTLSMGKQPIYYVQKSYRNEDGKPSTKYVERLGTLEDLEKRFGEKIPSEKPKSTLPSLLPRKKRTGRR